MEAVVEAHPGAVVCGLDYHPKKEVNPKPQIPNPEPQTLNPKP